MSPLEENEETLLESIRARYIEEFPECLRVRAEKWGDRQREGNTGVLVLLTFKGRNKLLRQVLALGLLRSESLLAYWPHLVKQVRQSLKDGKES